MTTPIKPPTRFGLETCQDLFEKLKRDALRLEQGWTTDDTFNFVVTAHHLYSDWIASCGSVAAKARKDSLPEPAKVVMQCIADLANGNKHWELTQPASVKNQVVTKVHQRIRGDAWSYYKAGPMVFVEFGGYVLGMKMLVDQALGYFKWIFEDGAVTFPDELLRQLETRKVPTKP